MNSKALILVMLYRYNFGQRYKGMMQGMDIYILKGQLAVFLFVIIVIIRTPIVHTQKVHYTQLMIPLLMRQVVFYEQRQLQQLVQGSVL
jgi:hypothetical protein